MDIIDKSNKTHVFEIEGGEKDLPNPMQKDFILSKHDTKVADRLK